MTEATKGAAAHATDAARWGRDADVATICRTIERKLTSEKDGADDEAFWRQMERMPLTR